jgi:hypothetical protein
MSAPAQTGTSSGNRQAKIPPVFTREIIMDAMVTNNARCTSAKSGAMPAVHGGGVVPDAHA